MDVATEPLCCRTDTFLILQSTTDNKLCRPRNTPDLILPSLSEVRFSSFSQPKNTHSRSAVSGRFIALQHFDIGDQPTLCNIAARSQIVTATLMKQFKRLKTHSTVIYIRYMARRSSFHRRIMRGCGCTYEHAWPRYLAWETLSCIVWCSRHP